MSNGMSPDATPDLPQATTQAATTQTASLWKNNNFVILFSGQMVSAFGDNLYGIAILWYVFALTHSKADLTITGFGTTLPPLLGLFVGVWVDRWRKKTVMIVSDIARGGLLFSLFLLTRSAHPSFWWVLALIVLVEGVGTLFDPAAAALMPRIVARHQFASASGIQQSAGALASLGGSLGGGALIGIIGAPLLFLSDAISFLASVLSLPFVRVTEAKRSRDGKATSLVQEWREGWQVILKSRYLTQSGISSAVTNFSLAGTGVLLTAWARDGLHGTAFTLSELLSGLLVGAIVGGLTVGWVGRKFRYRLIVAITLMGLGGGISAVALWANPYWDIASMAFAGLMLGWVDGLGGAIRMMVVPEDVRGRVFSTMRTLGRIAMPLGAAVLGVLMVYIPLWIALVLTGVGPIVSGISYLLPFSRAAFDEVDRHMSTAVDGESVT